MSQQPPDSALRKRFGPGQEPPAAERAAAAPSPEPVGVVFDPPGPGEIDLVVAPLPFADDRHRFENALRRVSGVRETAMIYHRNGVFRVRVTYRGSGRLATRLGELKGFHARVVADGRNVVQVLVGPPSDGPA